MKDEPARHRPKLSIIIPAHNEQRWIAETLEHIKCAAQAVPGSNRGRVEIFVVDNATTVKQAGLPGRQARASFKNRLR